MEMSKQFVAAKRAQKNIPFFHLLGGLIWLEM